VRLGLLLRSRHARGQLAGWALGFALLLFLITPDTPACFPLDGAPVGPGQILTYRVTESGPVGRRQWTLRLVPSRAEQDDRLLLSVRGFGAASPTILVDRGLRPAEPGELVEVPFAFGQRFYPGLLWLPPEDRRVGKLCAAGRVESLTAFLDAIAWEVTGEDGGRRLYDAETGLLVGFEVTLGQTETYAEFVPAD
jgi:hypothetical protein